MVQVRRKPVPPHRGPGREDALICGRPDGCPGRFGRITCGTDTPSAMIRGSAIDIAPRDRLLILATEVAVSERSYAPFGEPRYIIGRNRDEDMVHITRYPVPIRCGACGLKQLLASPAATCGWPEGMGPRSSRRDRRSWAEERQNQREHPRETQRRIEELRQKAPITHT
jgi:hypothetical protein